MPSPIHEACVDLFRVRPTLAAELIAGSLAVRLPRYSEASVEDSNLAQLAPTEYRSDLVVVLRTPKKPVFAVAVEVQLAPDAAKRFSWPVYGSTLRARLRAPACVLVVAPKRTVARWAATPIDTGQPGYPFAPLVLGPSTVPVVDDAARVTEAPELALLSAIAHGRGPRGLAVAKAVLAGIGALDEERRRIYADVTLSELNAAARKALEELMVAGKYEYQSELFKRLVAQGREEGLKEGLKEGIKQLAEAVLQVLELRGLPITTEQRERVRSCADLPTLNRWHAQALTATSAEEGLR